MHQKYKYKFRPGYGSENFLLEFSIYLPDSSFLNSFLDSLKPIEPTTIDTVDLFLNNGVGHNFNSKVGVFEVFVDIWGFVFVSAKSDQACIFKINELLKADDRFELIDSDPNDYKLATKAHS